MRSLISQLITAILFTILVATGGADAQAPSYLSGPPTPNAPVLICAGGAQVVHTGDTAQFTEVTCTIPANLIGKNGVVDIAAMWSVNNSAGSKTPRISFGGTTIYNPAATTVATISSHLLVVNRNATNSQIAAPTNFTASFGTSTAAVATPAVDTTSSVSVVFSCQLTVGTDNCNLERWVLRVTPN